MHAMSRAVTMAAVLTTTLASAAIAQRRAGSGPEPVAQREVRRVVPQQPAAAMTGPEWSLFGGIASGDGAYDLGIALGGTGRWHRADWPVAIRGDAYFAHHGGELAQGTADVSLNILGVMGSAEYVFPTTTSLKPYVFGGLGLFYSNANIDYQADPDPNYRLDGYDSSMDLGLGIGGGVRFTPRFGLELRVTDIGGFTTIPIVAVLHF